MLFNSPVLYVHCTHPQLTLKGLIFIDVPLLCGEQL